jgi:PAS domain S-box-containing protein
LEVAYNELKGELKSITLYLDSLVSHISQGLMFINRDGTITTFNNAMESIVGLVANKVLNHPYKEIFDDRQFGFSIGQALADKESPPPFQLDWGEKNLEIETGFISDEGAAEGLFILIRDITEFKKLEFLARRNRRMKELGELAAQVAHEIRNPLGGIKGFASLLKRDLKNEPELQKYTDYIIEGTDNLNRLVTQILNYARPLQPEMCPIDIKSLFEELKSAIEIDPNLKPTPRFLIDAAPGLSLFADPLMLKGALLNLLVNSVHAMPQGGEIVIKAGPSETGIMLQLSDTGIGIPEENLPKIFSPFFTTKANGNGFGLAEVHKVVEAHGGSIDVQSTAGKGTVFTIKLPIKGTT